MTEEFKIKALKRDLLKFCFEFYKATNRAVKLRDLSQRFRTRYVSIVGEDRALETPFLVWIERELCGANGPLSINRTKNGTPCFMFKRVMRMLLMYQVQSAKFPDIKIPEPMYVFRGMEEGLPMVEHVELEVRELIDRFLLTGSSTVPTGSSTPSDKAAD